MIFSRIFGTENTTRGASTWPRGSRARPLPHGPHVAPSTYSCTHTLVLPPKKNHQPAQTRVLAHLAAIFDLLAQSTIHQTIGEIVPWYVTPPLVQLVFVLVLYSLQICAA